jgi:hypothetical protein
LEKARFRLGGRDLFVGTVPKFVPTPITNGLRKPVASVVPCIPQSNSPGPPHPARGEGGKRPKGYPYPDRISRSWFSKVLTAHPREGEGGFPVVGSPRTGAHSRGSARKPSNLRRKPYGRSVNNQCGRVYTFCNLK